MSDNSTVTMDPNAKVYEFARKKGKDEFATEFQHQYIQFRNQEPNSKMVLWNVNLKIVK